MHFSLVSIGKPEIGMELCNHLGIDGGDAWIFADPENDAYDRLQLNRGWDTMLRPATAFRFRDRIFGGGKGSLDQVSRQRCMISPSSQICLLLSSHETPSSVAFFTIYSYLKCWANGKMVSTRKHDGEKCASIVP